MSDNLNSYIGRSLNRDAGRHGKKVQCSCRHVIQDVYDGLAIMLGPDYRRRIEAAMMDSETFQGSDEQFYLARAIRSAVTGPRRRPKEVSLGTYDAPDGDHGKLNHLVEMVTALQPALAKLSDLERYLLEEHYLDGKPYRDLAKELAIPRSTVCDTVARAARTVCLQLKPQEGEFV